MAKTRDDYAREGSEARAAGKPNIENPRSWQQNAFSEGWRSMDVAMMEDAQDEAAVPKVEVTEALTDGNFVMERVSPVKIVAPKWMPPDSVIHHMNHLNRKIAACSDDAARARYQRAHARVLKRWAKKIEHAPGGLR